MTILEGDLRLKTSKIAIIVPRFNDFINQHLLFGALDALKRIGNLKNNNIHIIRIPGAYEIPIISNIIANTEKYNGIIALGTIIQGETKHFDMIASTIFNKISEISIKNTIPISLGILTTNTVEQAIQRAGVKYGNKGYEAAITILEMINLIQIIYKKD
ncbi:6,7-dimethyl-8-ribityllumazine synthase [Buchnera aphidicola (Myzocallis carpini)]